MMDKKWNILAGIAVVLSLFLLVIPRLVPVCGMMLQTVKGGMVPMRCHYTYQAELIISIASLIVSGGLFFVRGTEGRRLGGLFLVLLGILTILLPQSWAIGICAHPGAPCHLTYLWTLGGGILLIAVGATLAWLSHLSVTDQRPQQEGDSL